MNREQALKKLKSLRWEVACSTVSFLILLIGLCLSVKIFYTGYFHILMSWGDNIKLFSSGMDDIVWGFVLFGLTLTGVIINFLSTLSSLAEIKDFKHDHDLDRWD